MHRLICTITLLLLSVFLFAQDAEDFYDKVWEELDTRNYKKAKLLLDEFIEAHPDDIEAFSIMSEYYVRTNNLPAGQAHMTNGRKRFGRNPEFYSISAKFNYSCLQFDQGIRDLNRAMEMTDNDSLRMDFLGQRGDTKSAKRDFEGAYEDYMVVFAFDSTDILILNNLGAMANELGKADQAIDYLQRIIDLDPEFNVSYINMGYQYQLMEAHEKALSYFNKAIELVPDDPYALSNRSYSLLKTGDLKGAMKDVEKSLKFYPSNSYAYRNRAHIYLAMGKKDKACEDLIAAENLGFSKMYGPEVRRLLMMNCLNYKSK